jgi:hypothetical protein
MKFKRKHGKSPSVICDLKRHPYSFHPPSLKPPIPKNTRLFNVATCEGKKTTKPISHPHSAPHSQRLTPRPKPKPHSVTGSQINVMTTIQTCGRRSTAKSLNTIGPGKVIGLCTVRREFKTDALGIWLRSGLVGGLVLRLVLQTYLGASL